jgi:hypothetical protein
MLTSMSRLSCLSEVRHYKNVDDDDDVNHDHLRRTTLAREVLRTLQILEHKVYQIVNNHTYRFLCCQWGFGSFGPLGIFANGAHHSK